MTKKSLAEKIKRRLGYPQVKVELDNSQIYDAIDYSRQKFIKWAVGQATQEVYFTMMLSAGQNFYDMPIGVTEVVGKGHSGISSGINTLFTIDNFLYNQGLFEALYSTGAQGYSIVSYHVARDFLETIRKYTPDKYNFKYHQFTNQVEIHPAPPSGNSLVLSDGTHDSPGFVLMRTYMIEGSTYDGFTAGDTDADFYSLDWIYDYATAECKIVLGYIRRKFDSFASIGNTGVSLDGSDLVSEGKEEKETLEERLKDEEAWDGWPIEIGY